MLLLWYGFDEDENISIGGTVAIPALPRKKPDEEIAIIIVSQQLAQTFWENND